MIIKKAKYKTVTTKVKKLVSNDVYGCDECKKEIKELIKDETSRLEVTIHNIGIKVEAENLIFCSWDCALKHLPKIKSDFFVSLPFLLYDVSEKNKCGAKRLINILNKNK